MLRYKRFALIAGILSAFAATGAVTVARAGASSEEAPPQRLFEACINPPADCETGLEGDECRLEKGCKKRGET